MRNILGVSVFYGITKNTAGFTQRLFKNEILVIFILTISFIIITTLGVFAMVVYGWDGLLNEYTKFNVSDNKEESYFSYLNTLLEDPKRLKLLPNKNYSIYYDYEKQSYKHQDNLLAQKLYNYRVPWQLLASIDFVKNMGKNTIADKVSYELRPIVSDYKQVEIETKIVTVSKSGVSQRSYTSKDIIINSISTYYMEANYKYKRYEEVPVESWVNRDSKGNIISETTKYQTVYKIDGDKQKYEKKDYKRLKETLHKYNIKSQSDIDFILLYARNMVNGKENEGLKME